MKSQKENTFFIKKEKIIPTPAPAPAPAKVQEKKELTQQQKNLERARKLDR
jgi:hypothetical protein